MSVLLGAVAPSNTGIVPPSWGGAVPNLPIVQSDPLFQPSDSKVPSVPSTPTIPSVPNFNTGGQTLPDAKVDDGTTSKTGADTSDDFFGSDNGSGASTGGSVMDKVKKYAPFIIGGAVVLYFVLRKK